LEQYIPDSSDCPAVLRNVKIRGLELAANNHSWHCQIWLCPTTVRGTAKFPYVTAKFSTAKLPYVSVTTSVTVFVSVTVSVTESVTVCDHEHCHGNGNCHGLGHRHCATLSRTQSPSRSRTLSQILSRTLTVVDSVKDIFTGTDSVTDTDSTCH
jgi:hypothetical protein